MTTRQKNVVEALTEECRQLDAQAARLKSLAAELPDCDGAERGRLESLVQLRGVIECVLADRLAPAAATLRQAARRSRRGRRKADAGPVLLEAQG